MEELEPPCRSGTNQETQRLSKLTVENRVLALKIVKGSHITALPQGEFPQNDLSLSLPISAAGFSYSTVPSSVDFAASGRDFRLGPSSVQAPVRSATSPGTTASYEKIISSIESSSFKIERIFAGIEELLGVNLVILQLGSNLV